MLGNPRLGSPSLAVGVGHVASALGQLSVPREDEDPITDVRGTDGGCRHAVPLRVVPALGQISEYSSQPVVRNESAEGWHVLHEDESRS